MIDGRTNAWISGGMEEIHDMGYVAQHGRESSMSRRSRKERTSAGQIGLISVPESASTDSASAETPCYQGDRSWRRGTRMYSNIDFEDVGKRSVEGCQYRSSLASAGNERVMKQPGGAEERTSSQSVPTLRSSSRRLRVVVLSESSGRAKGFVFLFCPLMACCRIQFPPIRSRPPLRFSLF
jgi:hypothetical protein